jgi:metal-responsive CopG/Arc/MetJ family transcriptional regulator
MMNDLKQLEKQQVGLRLPKYLVDDIDEFTKKFSVNRTDIIIEAVKSYVSEQKANIFYDNFNTASKELSTTIKEHKTDKLQTLDTLIDELKNS